MEEGGVGDACVAQHRKQLLRVCSKPFVCTKLSEEGDRKIPEVSRVLHLAVTVF